MKRFLSLLAVGAVSVALANDASAQSRNFGAERFILDDNSTHRITLEIPHGTMTGNATYTFPWFAGITAANVVLTEGPQVLNGAMTFTQPITINTDGGPNVAPNNLIISESTLTRVGNIAVNPGAGNFLTTDGGVTQTGAANQNTFAGNVDATNGLDVTGALLTANAGATITGPVNINATTTGSTVIGNTAGASSTTINVGNTVASNLTLNGIINDAAPTQMLTLTNPGNAVRTTQLATLANEGVSWDAGQGRFELGGENNTAVPFVANPRWVNINNSTLNFSANNGALIPLQITGTAAPTVTATASLITLNSTGAINETAAGTMTLASTAGNITMNVGGAAGNVNVNGNVLPTADNAFDLGSPALRWDDVYVGPASMHVVSKATDALPVRDWAVGITGGATGDLTFSETGTTLMTLSSPAGNLDAAGTGTFGAANNTVVGTSPTNDIAGADGTVNTPNNFNVNANFNVDAATGNTDANGTVTAGAANAVVIGTSGANEIDAADNVINTPDAVVALGTVTAGAAGNTVIGTSPTNDIAGADGTVNTPNNFNVNANFTVDAATGNTDANGTVTAGAANAVVIGTSGANEIAAADGTVNTLGNIDAEGTGTFGTANAVVVGTSGANEISAADGTVNTPNALDADGIGTFGAGNMVVLGTNAGTDEIHTADGTINSPNGLNLNGNFTVSPAGNTVNNGSLQVNGVTTLNGNINMGDGNDIITLNANGAPDATLAENALTTNNAANTTFALENAGAGTMNVGIGTTTPAGQLANTSNNPIIGVFGIAPTAFNWEVNGGGYAAMINQNNNGVSGNGLGINLGGNNPAAYGLAVQTFFTGIVFGVAGDGRVHGLNWNITPAGALDAASTGTFGAGDAIVLGTSGANEIAAADGTINTLGSIDAEGTITAGAANNTVIGTATTNDIAGGDGTVNISQPLNVANSVTNSGNVNLATNAGSTTNIGNVAAFGDIAIGNATGATGNVTVGVGTGGSLSLNGIDTDPNPTHMLTFTNNTAVVNKVSLAGTANEGVSWDAAQFRYELGSEVANAVPFTAPTRYVDVNNSTLNVTRNGGAEMALQVIGGAAGAVNLQTTSGNANIGNATGTNTVLGSTNVTGNTTINSGANAFTTNIATAGNTGAVNIGNAGTGGAVTIASGSDITLNADGGANDVVVSGDVLPSVDNNWSLGSPAQRWINVYATPASFHTYGTAAEVGGSIRDWSMGINATGNYRIGEIATAGDNELFSISPAGNVVADGSITGTGLTSTNGDLNLTGAAPTIDIDGGAVLNLRTGGVPKMTFTDTGGGLDVVVAGNVTGGDARFNNYDNDVASWRYISNTGKAGRFTTISLTPDNSSDAVDLTLTQTAITRTGSIAINPGAANSITSDGNFALDGDITLNGGGTVQSTLGNPLLVNATGSTLTLAGTAITANGLITSNNGITIVDGQNLTANGAVTLGNGNDNLNLNAGTGSFTLSSSGLDVSAAGAVSGATTIDASGAITGASLTATTGNITATLGNIAATAGSVSAGTTVTAGTTMTAGTGITSTLGNINAQGGALQTAGVTRIANNGDATLGATTATSLTVSGTTTLNGIANIGDGGDAVAINSNAFSVVTPGAGIDVTAAGAISNATSIQGTGALTMTGAGSVIGSGANATQLTISGVADAGVTNELVVTGDAMVTGTATLGALALNGDLDMNGHNITEVGDLTFNGAGDVISNTASAVQVADDLNVTGNGTFGTGLTVTAGGATITGNSTVNGTITVNSGANPNLVIAEDIISTPNTLIVTATNTLTVGTPGTFNAGGQIATNIGDPAGTLTFNSTGLNVAATGDISDANSAVIINDPQGLTVSAGGAAITGNSSVAGTFNQTGGGQVTLSGNVDATNGLDVTNANLTVGGAATFSVDDATGNTSTIGLITAKQGGAGQVTLGTNATSEIIANDGTLNTPGSLNVGVGAVVGNGLTVTTGGLNVLAGGSTVQGLTVQTGGLTVSAGGINANGTGITNAGPVSGVTTLNANGNLTTTGALVSVGSNGTDGKLVLTDGSTNVTGTLQATTLTAPRIWELPDVAGTISVGGITNGTLNNSTLRWNGTSWVENTNFLVTGGGQGTFANGVNVTAGGIAVTAGNSQFGGNINMQTNIISNIGNAGTDFTATGGLTLADVLTVSAGGANIAGGLTATGGSTLSGGITVNGGSTFNANVNMGGNRITNIGAGGSNFTAAGGLNLGGVLSANVAGNTIGDGTAATQLTISGVADAGATRELIVTGDAQVTGNLSVGSMTLAGDLDMGNNRILNIGAAGTDFTATGGLTLADALTVSAGGASVTGGLNNNAGGITNAGAITGATNVTASGTVQGANVTATGTLTTDNLAGAGANRFAQRALISSFPVVGSTYTIANDNVTATSVIILTIEDPGGVIPAGYIIGNRVVGTSFDLTLPAPADGDDVINYMIIN